MTNPISELSSQDSYNLFKRAAFEISDFPIQSLRNPDSNLIYFEISLPQLKHVEKERRRRGEGEGVETEIVEKERRGEGD